MSSQRSIPTVDRISTMPDSVIHHILSFFPTKQAAATSILSKRWNPLWLSVPTLDFDDQNFADFATFRHFVYSVMLLRNITTPIRSFQLKCGKSSGFNPHDVNRFIHAAVQRGIQNLILDMLTPTIYSRYYYVLPQCVLTCNNLIVLKLKQVIIPFAEVNFPLLKTLHLEIVCLRSCFLKKFLHGCPVIEDLQLETVLVLDIECGELNCLLKLVKANIFNMVGRWDFLFAWVHNAKFLCAELMNRPYGCQIPTFFKLTHLKIIFEQKNDWLGKWKWMTEVLQNCPKLQDLTILENSSDRDEVGDGDWVDPPKCLSSELRTFSLIAYEGIKCEFQFVEYILKNAKGLHTMKISASKKVDLNIKHQMLLKLSLCPRGSTTCKLSFD